MQKVLVRWKFKAYNVPQVVAILLTAIYLAALAYIVISRINYRYHLDWVEGVTLVQVYRIMNGQGIYTPPSLEFIPMMYPPLYFYLAAIVTKLVGFGFLPLRLVSVASTLGCMVIIYLAVKNGTCSAWLGFVGVGLFAATFRAGGAWFDIGRVDMLFVFLSLSGIYFLEKATNWNSILAGILFALSLLTKQTVLPILGMAFLSILITSPRQALYFLAGFGIPSLVVYFILNRLTEGWYKYYLIVLPATHLIRWSAIPASLIYYLGAEVVMLAVSYLPLLLGFRKVLMDKTHRHYLLTTTALVGTSILAAINPGAYDNSVIPAYAGLSILTGLGIGWLGSYPSPTARKTEAVLAILWLVVCIQFIQLRYDPLKQIPTHDDLKAGDTLVTELREASGNVFIPYHNYLALYAGKKVYFDIGTYNDLAGVFATRPQPMAGQIKNRFRSTPFSLIIMDDNGNSFKKAGCQNSGSISYQSDKTFLPVTGWQIRPTNYYAQCP